RTMPMTGSVPPPVSSHQQPAASAPRPQRSSVVAGILVMGALVAFLGIGWALLSAPTVESGVAGGGAAASPGSTRSTSSSPALTPQLTATMVDAEETQTLESPTLAAAVLATATYSPEPPTPHATDTPSAPTVTD